MSEKINLYGDCVADIGMFVGAIERALGKRVLITDRNGKLKSFVNSGDDGVMEIKGMTYTTSDYKGDDIDLEIAFCNAGEAADGKINIYAFSECYNDLFNYEQTVNEEEPANSMILIRDSFSVMSKQAKNIGRRLKVTDIKTLKPEKSEHEARLSFELNGEIKPLNTSSQIQKIVYGICNKLDDDFNEKTYNKAVKAVQKGRM